jgi:nicotinate-nucleotide adenylyltransferase
MQNLPIGILGGTFDPIHLGHTWIAKAIINLINLDKILFVPCNQSPLKNQTVASAQDRLNMVKIAIKNKPKFLVDDCEIKRGGLSYTLDTLKTLKQVYPKNPLVFIIGIDAFNQFDEWEDRYEILKLAHLIIENRPGFLSVTSPKVMELLEKYQTKDAKDLQKQTAGLIYLIDIQPLPIAATQIRNLIKNHQSASNLVAKEVWKYIDRNQLYVIGSRGL